MRIAKTVAAKTVQWRTVLVRRVTRRVLFFPPSNPPSKGRAGEGAGRCRV